MNIITNKILLKGLVIAVANIVALHSVFADSSREMEPILTVNSDNAAILLADDPSLEEHMLVSYEAAAALLGDEEIDGKVFDQLNSLPATAAGNNDVIYIDADAAEALLGDTH
ncbi:MAG: hypothetical protein ACI9FB_001412 [Candidatus Azotimanducaceae bacterium]|jgi:hypothetical protein